MQGLQTGDVRRDRALIWARSDRSARLCVEWADNPAFQRAQRVLGPAALEDSDFTARMQLAGLLPDREVTLRVSFQDLAAERVLSEPWIGQFRTPAHYYDPTQAQFSDFDPFWEFVSGPLNAGSFGPNVPDPTFGVQVVYQKAPETAGVSPLAGYQFFGEVEIDSASAELTVTLRDVEDHALWTRTLQPE